MSWMALKEIVVKLKLASLFPLLIGLSKIFGLAFPIDAILTEYVSRDHDGVAHRDTQPHHFSTVCLNFMTAEYP